jgi:hypothetical protein
MASAIDLDRVRRNDDRLSTLQLILSGAVDLTALKGVLRVNTKVSEVIIYVDESFLVELPVEETHDLFRTIGGMPNLQKLGFHSQSGSSGVLSIKALIAITSPATRMVHFGISDVALWGSQADFQLWATQLQTQLFLQSFCVCECELLDPSKECPLDPLLTVLSILPSLEALFLQAATPNALGQVSPEAVAAIGMAPQLQDLRLGNFELKHPHMVQMGKVLSSNVVLTELKIDSCVELHRETAVAMAKMLRNNRRLKSFELGLTSMIPDDCAVVLAESLKYNTTMESFTLSKGTGARFRPITSQVCQTAFVDMLHQNYVLETLVLFQRFPVKKEFKLYLTLNKYGRGKLLMSHASEREDWIQAIYKVNDDLDSIFYYLGINPSLCSHCFDQQEVAEEEEAEPQHGETGLLSPDLMHFEQLSMAQPACKRPLSVPSAAETFLRSSGERSKRIRRSCLGQLPISSMVSPVSPPPPMQVEQPQFAAMMSLQLQQASALSSASALQQQLVAMQHHQLLVARGHAHQAALSSQPLALPAAYNTQLQQLLHHQPHIALRISPQLQQSLAAFSPELLANLRQQIALQQQLQLAASPANLFAAAAAAAAHNHLQRRHPNGPHF